MHPDACKRLVRETKFLDTLVKAGKLPECVFPRPFKIGHKVLHGIWQSRRKYRCIKCEQSWEVDTTWPPAIAICENCGAREDDPEEIEDQIVFDITGDHRLACWECRSCSHQWTSEEGTKCPSCDAVCEK